MTLLEMGMAMFPGTAQSFLFAATVIIVRQMQFIPIPTII